MCTCMHVADDGRRVATLKRSPGKKAYVYDLDSAVDEPLEPIPVTAALPPHAGAQSITDDPVQPAETPVFHRYHDLRGHDGPVYTLKYSTCGRLLASG